MRAHASLIYVGICLIFLFGLHRHDFPLLATKIHSSYNLTYVKVRKNDPFIRGGKKKASLSLHHRVTKNTFCSWSTRKGPVNQDWQQFENVFYFFSFRSQTFSCYCFHSTFESEILICYNVYVWQTQKTFCLHYNFHLILTLCMVDLTRSESTGLPER